ncbi:MAG: multicopper oxidase domain-containing protein [Gemmatimonadaceae bacterium]
MRRARGVRAVLLAALLAGTGCSTGTAGVTSTEVRANDNRTSAGVLKDGVLTLALVATQATWHPAAATDSSLVVAAFAVEGDAPQIPGPLIRVPLGTQVKATVRNTLSDTLVLCKLRQVKCELADGVRVAPGESGAFDFEADQWGTSAYRAVSAVPDSVRPRLDDRQLMGGVVVDSVGSTTDDRVMVINTWVSPADSFRFVQAINGKTWPHTERFSANVGDSLRWRWINAGATEHPMHLHGFYFRLESRGDVSGDTLIAADARPLEVTENLGPWGVATIAWSPSRGGQWLFHCHKAAHMSGNQHAFLAGTPIDTAMHMDGAMHMARDMGGLIMAINVTGDPTADLPVAASPAAVTRFDLSIIERAHYFKDSANALTFEVLPSAPAIRGPDPVPGPLLTLTRGVPVEIVVHNRIGAPSTVHWHGLELEGVYDGVAGFSGVSGSVTPMIAPRDSFVARFTPLRSGTFMYHSHVNEESQMARGLVAPIVVLEPGERFDATRDHVLLFAQHGPGDLAQIAVNGRIPAAPIVLRAGVPNRLRLINITAIDEVTGEVSGNAAPLSWRVVATDGAAAPPSTIVSVPARFRFGPGQIIDVELTVPKGRYGMKVVTYNNFEIPLVAR